MSCRSWRGSCLRHCSAIFWVTAMAKAFVLKQRLRGGNEIIGNNKIDRLHSVSRSLHLTAW